MAGRRAGLRERRWQRVSAPPGPSHSPLPDPAAAVFIFAQAAGCGTHGQWSAESGALLQGSTCGVSPAATVRACLLWQSKHFCGGFFPAAICVLWQSAHVPLWAEGLWNAA